MERGSKGPHVDIWINHMIVFAAAQGVEDHGLVPDQTYGAEGVGWTRAFQAYHGLKPDSGVGNDTRTVAREKEDFDFVRLCLATPGTTEFVQLDGTVVEWASPAVSPIPAGSF